MGTKPTRPAQPVVARLDPNHDRTAFDCGVEPLNRYLLTQATQDLRRGLALPYVATFPPAASIVGYFTLSAASIDLGDLPETVRRKLPGGAVLGAGLLGRLAVDRRYQGRGVAEHMLMAAIDYSFARSPLACVALVVDAISPAAADFYARYGFIQLPDGARRLFLLRDSLAKYL
jgi:ribosomal protein S18 acetylase RimI-like enzyme